MPKRSMQESVRDKQAAERLADKARDLLGARPSEHAIRRITYEAEVYARLQRGSEAERRKADARVAKSVADLRTALQASAVYHDTYSIVLGPDCQDALANLEQIAQGLSKKARAGRPRNTRLRRLCDVVLDAYWEVHKAKIGRVGIYTRRTDNTLYGPVLDMVKEALRIAGVRKRKLPSDLMIRRAAREACQTKIDFLDGK